MKIKFVSANSNGDFYVGHIVQVQRGIKGRNGEKSLVDELLIVGVPKAKMQKFCLDNNLVVQYDKTNNKVLNWYVKGEKNNAKIL